MKKLLLILTLCLAFACKKKETLAIDDITSYKWPLQSATVSPVLTVDGKSSSNFMTLSGPSSCLNNNYALSFSSNGSYAFTSTGPLCDMFSFQNAKWTKSGNEITLNTGFGNTETVNLKGTNIIQKYTFEKEGKTYTVTYIFTAKSK
ncbi:hypothetical protein SRABI27_01403 [Pedobacter sp. Bi27]|uniref:hypothetical protein n=1 Tax=unclassified Pedobacter TaxID=2628915 RepID=UPI001DF80048|nr:MULTISPECIES: hypothetical protein [unclassified Pedobacter]CAH0163052.1 hypothetical protein SRABI36_01065 [Pedobacter sp. Bi36]CAH0187141.1 hypothetical protein SRABI27_01403 [Pedobacter sp. Bi27]CAH0218813.1 hypothetical protein SRABI126_02156 [Pedobacter sp. Bi126]